MKSALRRKLDLLAAAVALAISAVLTGTAFGYTEYVWTGNGAVDARGYHAWCDSANWKIGNSPVSDGSSPGFAAPGVPFTDGRDTRACFESGVPARVSIPQSFTLTYFSLSGSGKDVTLTSDAGSSNVVLTAYILVSENPSSPNLLRLENVGVKFTNGTYYHRPTYHFYLTDADLTLGNLDQWFANTSITLERSSLHCSSYTFGNVGSTMTIKDGWLDVSGNVKFGSTADGGVLRFEGSCPRMTVKGKNFYSGASACFPKIEFMPGVGGFTTAPIESPAGGGSKFLSKGSGGETGNYTIDLDATANLFKTDNHDVVPLVFWPQGVDTSRTTYNSTSVEGVTFYASATLDPLDW